MKRLGDLLVGEVTIGDLVDVVAEKFPQREGLVVKNERMTFSELKERVDLLAKAFLRHGIGKGDKVAVWLSNRPEFIYTFLALGKIGAVLVPLNTRYKTFEFEDTLRRSDCVALVTADHFLKIDFMNMIREVLPELRESSPGSLHAEKCPKLRQVITVSEEKHLGTLDFDTFMSSGEGYPDSELERAQRGVGSEDIAVLMFTAGTTGLPKGVLLTHHMTGHHFLTGERIGVTEVDRGLLFLPLCHIFALASCFINHLSHGACTVLQEYFDPGESLRLMAEERITFLGCVPTNVVMMLNHEDFPKYQSALKLRRGIIGGAPVAYKLLMDIYEKMKAGGMCQGYGQTECCGVTSMTVNGERPEIVASSLGKPASDYEVKIINPETGEILPYDTEGELVVRGRACMRGYYKMPKETAGAMDSEGWIRSGDLVRMDKDHNLYFVGRVKDIFIVGGENVAPAEVENFLFSHPKVKDVQVIGVPDERLGEVPAAFILLKEGEKAKPEEIIDYSKGKVASYKVPRYVKFLNEYPLTASGKVQKFKLREIALKEWQLPG
ncbi:MAG: AMP-binding protein [Deltaproteobacteria bacterium]|nr:AMP-binding protein [Deltaproteobacteria bacterium]